MGGAGAIPQDIWEPWLFLWKKALLNLYFTLHPKPAAQDQRLTD